jgi:hypothetical protein
VHGIGFVDDVNLVAWGATTRGNCDNLERLHQRCLEWAGRHGAKFAPEKYELMHLTRHPRKFDMTQTLRIGGTVKEPVEEVRILGLQLDPKLRWKAHKAKVLDRMNTQTNALTKLTGSTWGIPMIQARQVYTMVIRPAMTYAAHTWHQPAVERGRGLALSNRLQKIQNKCLRVVTGGFRATPIKSLETLAHVPPLDLYLTSRVVAYRKRAKANGTDDLIAKATARIRRTMGRPQTHGATGAIGHPYPMPEDWVDNWIRVAGAEGEELDQVDPQARRQRDKKAVWLALRTRWEERWRAAPRSAAEAVPQPPDARVLQLHEGLHKAESSILTQLRTGKIGLADFLHKAGVPEVTSTACSCGYEKETPRHVTVFCSRFGDTRERLRISGSLSFRALLTTVEGVRRVTRWWLRRGILGQFQLASELIR